MRADRRMLRFLNVVDDYVRRAGLDAEICPPRRPAAIHLPPTPTSVDLDAEQIGTVLLATGYRPHHPWLQLPITGPDGRSSNTAASRPARGMYVVGQRFQHRRDSAFIDGARHDAETVVRHLLAQAGGLAAPCVACEEPAA